MDQPYVVYSAETYVHEPAELWTDNLPEEHKADAFKLVKKEKEDGTERWVWSRADGKPVAGPGESGRGKEEETTAEALLAKLDQEGISGAVLFPSVAHRAYSVHYDTKKLSAFLECYNDWVLDLASHAPDRLKAIPCLNVDNPFDAAEEMKEMAARGAAGFVIPMAPGEGLRYDMPQFEALWQASHDLGKPVIMLNGSHRHIDQEKAERRKSAFDVSVAAKLAHKATSFFSVRRSVTAIVYTGAVERYPNFRLGIVGFGSAWAPFAMIRADEVYEVRPERTGPPTRVPEHVAGEELIRQTMHLREQADRAVRGEERSGTKGMAPEGVGFYFQSDEKFSDHFRRGVFCTFTLKGRLSMRTRHFLGQEGLLWGHRHPAPGTEDIPPVQERIDEAFERLTAEDKHRLVSQNAAKIFGFEQPAAG